MINSGEQGLLRLFLLRATRCNIIKNAGEDGIKVHQAKGFSLSGNVIENAGTGGGSNYDGGIDFVAVKDSVVEGNTVLKSGGNSCLMLKGGTANNEITSNTFSGCKDAIHLGGLTTDQFMAPGSGGKEAYGNTIANNNLCGSNASVFMFDGEKKRQDNTVKGNGCNGASDDIAVTGTSSDVSSVTTHDDVPKAKLPDNSAADAEYKKQVNNMAGAKKTLTQATATKMPSVSMAELREQLAAKNKVNCN